MTTINLRLSPKLETLARARAEDLGISINALMSVAIDAYLGRSAGQAREESHADFEETRPAPAVRTAMSPPGPNASKKERQQWTAFQRSQRKLELGE